MATTTGYRIGEFRDVAGELQRLDAQANVIAELEDAAFARLGLPDAGRALDVGCGPGFVAARLRAAHPALELWGLDLDRQALALASRNMPTVRADARSLPFAAGQFDLVLTRLMLRHIPEPERALAEMARVARRGGMVLVEECDDGSMVIEPEPAGFAQASAARHASLRRRGAEPHLGRRLLAMMRQAGLTDIDLCAVPVTSTDIGIETFMKVVLLPVSEAIDPDLLAPEAVLAARDAIAEWGRASNVFGMTTLLVLRGCCN